MISVQVRDIGAIVDDDRIEACYRLAQSVSVCN